MKKHIAEELPARKHSPAEAPSSEKGGEEGKKEGGKTPEKRVKQAIYDIRYRARREELPIRQAYSQYMQNSSMSQQEKTMVKQKLFGKAGVQAEDFNIEDLASSSLANALFKVFVEGVQEEQEPIRLTYMEKLETSEHKKYKVRVTGKDGRSYVRYADRQKISELRANSNIESVEMTGYGEPYEGEKKKGEQTARAKAGKDYDGDGKVESGAKEYRGAVHNAIQRKKGGKSDGQDTSSVKEEYIGEVNDESSNPDANAAKIDVMKGKNTVKVNPEAPGSNSGKSNYGMQLAHYDMEGSFVVEKAVSKSQQKFMGMVYAAKKGEMPASPEVAKAAAGMSKKEAKKFATTSHKGLPETVKESGYFPTPEAQRKDEAKYNLRGQTVNPRAPQTQAGAKMKPSASMKEENVTQADKKAKKEMEEKDPRSIPTAVNLAKNYARAMGAKNPIVMVSTEETEILDERRREEKGIARKPRDRAIEMLRKMPSTRQGLMTRSGKTVAQHEGERGVKKTPGAPTSQGETTADRLSRRKAQQASAEKRSQDMYKPRAGESD
jgi:hypothetical protein